MKRVLRRSFTWLAAISLLIVGAIAFSYRSIPASNTRATHFDVIIVLGTPSMPDGSVSPEQRSRVLEAVRELRAGVAPRLILTGGAAHNQFAEAHTMAELAAAEGVSRANLVEEGRAQNTVQNIFYSKAIMDRFGWESAEIVSSPSHLPRAALILEHYSFPWRTHAAPWPPIFLRGHIAAIYAAEAIYCARLRWIGFPRTGFLPAAH